jgi:hypothetical protein
MSSAAAPNSQPVVGSVPSDADIDVQQEQRGKRMKGIIRFMREHGEEIAMGVRWYFAHPESYPPAQRMFRSLSVKMGGGRNPYLFTEQDASTKLRHNGDVFDNWVQIVMYLSPHRESGVLNMCPWSTSGCRATCLHDAGRLHMPPAQIAQRVRTQFLAEDPYYFGIVFAAEVDRHWRKAQAQGLGLVTRPNGTSDAPWEMIDGFFDPFPRRGLLWQDYTKDGMAGQLPTRHLGMRGNYYLVRSVHERTPDDVFKTRHNVVMVVDVKRGGALPERWRGRDVVDGDKHDLRVFDPQGGKVVMVRAKGRAIGDTSGFVRSV